MAKINVLDKHVAELIAAGEVVERPASVIKELAENSIDAGAKNVTIEIQGGGASFMRVTDDGCGIEPGELEHAFMRHATSKICEADDLNRINTFGFRGEALASVAAVAHTEMITRTPDAQIGARCEASDSEIGDVEEAGCPLGTTIVVRDLFYNTPARMKFMKKDVAEGNAVASVVDKMALSYPEVRFVFIRDGETKLATAGNGKLEDVISSVYGREFSREMVPVDYSPETAKYLHVTGFVTKPSAARTSRAAQNFFVNRRFVKTRTAMAALEEAFKGSIMVGKFPGCVLNIEMPPQAVDVNVHPAKIEVRFQNEKDIFDLVYYGVKSALHGGDSSAISAAFKKSTPVFAVDAEPQEQTRLEKIIEAMKSAPSSPAVGRTSYDGWASSGSLHNRDNLSGYKPDSQSSHTVQNKLAEEARKAAEEGRAPVKEYAEAMDILKKAGAPLPEVKTENTDAGGEMPQLKYIGELFSTYAVFEGLSEMVLVDKHAAHERILYEKLRAQNGSFDRQVLLVPAPVSLSDDERCALLENAETLERFGFVDEDFGRGAVLVREAPLWCPMEEIQTVTGEIAAALLECRDDVTPEKLDGLYHSMACRAAIKAHDKTTPDEMRELAAMVIDEDVRYCPHGRPVSVSISRAKLEKMFGRQQ